MFMYGIFSKNETTHPSPPDCENESDDDKGPKQGSMSILIHGANTAENKDESGHKDRSVSTKGTVSSISTSLRSGLSSVQNVGSRSISTDLGGSTSGRLGHGIMSPVDGSTSLRTGLSSVQVPPPANEGDEDINGSVSMRTGLSSIQSVKANGAETTASESYIDLSSPRTLSQHHSQHPPQANVQFPETIHEEDEDSALKKRSETPVPVKEESLLSGRSTATTDNSTGRSTSGGSESGSNSGLEGGTTGYEGTTDFDTVTESESGFKPRPTKLKTETFESVSAYDTAFDTALDTALESPVSSKWKTFGLKMPSVIKQVLSKASPRVGNPATPSRQTPTQSGVSKPVEFSSDDEEDIFGGLEETSLEDCGAKNNFGNKPTSKSRTPKTFFSKNAKGDSTPRRSTRSERSSNRKKENSQHMRSVRSERIPIQDIKPVTLKNFKTVPPSPAAATNPNSLYSNDRSGTVVDEYEVLNNVNSDITSSLIGGNGPSTAKKQDRKTTPKKSKGDKNKKNTRDRSKTPEPATSKSKKSKKAKTDKSPKLETPVVPPAEGEPKTKEASGKKPDTSAPENADGEAENAKPLSPKAASASMFMNFDCGIVDTLTTVCHFGSKTTETEAAVPVEDGLSAISNTSSDNLTDLEKRVWNEWDRLNLTAPQKATETTAKDEEHDRKREVARGKLLEIANSAISSQMTAKDEDEEQEQQPVESSDYTCSSGSIETGEEGESSGGSGSGSSGVSGSSSEDHTASASASSYYSGTDSEFVSEFPSAPKPTKQPAATPMLLSFSQRSLIEKFSNQLSTDGIEVLKLNHRKKWQVRYFTVSREVIALTAHEAKSQSGDVAQCPKALLWMKKFNAKNGGYGISNIDKQGHGGMMLIDLTDVHVVEKEGDEIPLPKNLIKKFKNSVLIKLEHTIKGEKRSIGFRCKNNDEAQFLCTCMRVIRDLLKRERSMRKKSTNKI